MIPCGTKQKTDDRIACAVSRNAPTAAEGDSEPNRLWTMRTSGG